jgi:SAM-dependent methyltransferase
LSRLRRLAGGVSRRAQRALFPPTEAPAEHWQRVAMNAAVDTRLSELDLSSCSAAEISGRNHAARPWGEYVELGYPEFDVCEPLTVGREFDVVICEQVLEHVPDPFGAAENLLRLCVPGGLAIVSTPFLIKLHELVEWRMFDYWRFTPRGMRTMLERAGFEIEAVESWGNRECVVGNFSDWSAYRRWHSLRNEPDFPVQVWAFARRPAR